MAAATLDGAEFRLMVDVFLTMNDESALRVDGIV
jgi:hypothetical protein